VQYGKKRASIQRHTALTCSKLHVLFVHTQCLHLLANREIKTVKTLVDFDFPVQATEKVVIVCTHCQTQNRDVAHFCRECDQFLDAVCHNCAHELPANAHFCDICGLKLANLTALRGLISTPSDRSLPVTKSIADGPSNCRLRAPADCWFVASRNSRQTFARGRGRQIQCLTSFSALGTGR